MLITLLATAAMAQDVTWSFEAEATTNISSAYSGLIAPGDTLTGSVTFDTPADTSGTYQDVVIDAEFSALGQTWDMLSGGSASVTNSTTDHFATGWTFQGPNLTGSTGQTLTPSSINIAVFDNDGTMFDSRAFPSPPPPLSAIETNQFVVRFADTVNGGTPQVVYEITSWQEVAGPDSCPDTPKTDPGLCGCEYEDLSVSGGTACVHYDASIDPAATLSDGVRIDAGVVVGASTVGVDVLLSERVTVGDGSDIGATSIVARRAIIGDNVTIGSGATLDRSSTVRDGSDIGSDVSLGFGAALGPAANVGERLTVGSLADLDGVVTGDDVVVARGAQFTGIVTLNDFVVVGPDVVIGDGSILDSQVRVRKDAVLGRRVTLGHRTRLGRDALLGDDAGVGQRGNLGARVTMGTFAHLQDDVVVPRTEVYPDDYDHDDDGALSIAMGGNDCDDFNASAIDVCVTTISTFGGIKSWSDGSYAASCDDYRNPSGGPVYSGDTGSGQYNIDPDGDTTPFIAYCDMSTSTGWTLAANIGSGSASNWTYHSTWWTNSGAAQAANPSPSAGEARYEPFDALPYDAIRLVDPSSGREVHLTDSHSSLVSRFASVPQTSLSDNGNGGHTQSSRTMLSATRYDAQSFSYFTQFNALSICSNAQANDTSGWAANSGIAINDRGRYDASNGSIAQGRARLGYWTGGSNSFIWSQTADCGFGLGVETQRDSSVTATGTTMGSLTTMWVR